MWTKNFALLISKNSADRLVKLMKVVSQQVTSNGFQHDIFHTIIAATATAAPPTMALCSFTKVEVTLTHPTSYKVLRLGES